MDQSAIRTTDQPESVVSGKPTAEDLRRRNRDLAAYALPPTAVFGAVQFARGLRYKNWPAVAEFMESRVPVWVGTVKDALDLQDAIAAIPGGKSTRREEGGQWKVIRLDQ